MEMRFDDALGGASFRLTGLADVIEARRPEQVVPALERVERAVAGGRWAGGFLAYEAAPGLDPALVVRPRPPGDPLSGLPLAWFGVFEGREEIDALAGLGEEKASTPGPWEPSITREAYRSAISRIHEHILAGDTYQVNLTFRLRTAFDGDDRALYRDLCLAQHGAFGAYVDVGRYAVCSASPELFFEIRGDRIATRPMKGTARRGRWPAEDAEHAAELIASSKERAENAMIVDLLRNDLGRISVPGSVRVPELYAVERYDTVWQMTSTVTSELPASTPVSRVLGALFPSGSVTGAPKIRSMQIIAEREDGPRGVYTGAVGYLAPPEAAGECPRAAFNVAIRTVVVDREGGLAEYGVGGGITYDSSAEAEYEECRTKAEVLTVRRPGFDLLETLLYRPGAGIHQLREHLDRMRSSAAYFGFRFDRAGAEDELRRAAAAWGGEGPARLRLTVDRGGRARSTSSPLPATEHGPVRLAVDLEAVDPRDPLLYHKTTHREPYRRRSERHPRADDVLLVNDRGEVTESTIANLAVRIDGRWWTPPLDAGLLAGIERNRLVSEGVLAERPITIGELRTAESLALVSSVRGWRDAELLDVSYAAGGAQAPAGSSGPGFPGTT